MGLLAVCLIIKAAGSDLFCASNFMKVPHDLFNLITADENGADSPF